MTLLLNECAKKAKQIHSAVKGWLKMENKEKRGTDRSEVLGRHNVNGCEEKGRKAAVCDMNDRVGNRAVENVIRELGVSRMNPNEEELIEFCT